MGLLLCHVGMCVECVMSFVWALGMAVIVYTAGSQSAVVSCNDVTVYTCG